MSKRRGSIEIALDILRAIDMLKYSRLGGSGLAMLMGLANLTHSMARRYTGLLKDAGYIKVSRKGRAFVFELTEKGVEALRVLGPIDEELRGG